MSKGAIPIVSGISPHQGVPGTQIKIRGENLGLDSTDLLALIICGTDCLVSSKWKSPSQIIARLGQAKRGMGDIVIVTRSGGKGISTVQFRVLIEEIGSLQESSVWIDEHRTVPGRNVVRNILETVENEDALGFKINNQSKVDELVLSKLFAESSGNLRLENFHPAWYLLEKHKKTSLVDLKSGLTNLQNTVNKEEEMSRNVRKANLNSLIDCVNALAFLHLKINNEIKNGNWPIAKVLSKKLNESKQTADKSFKEVLTRKDRADATRNALSVLTRFRFIFFLAESIDDNMAKGEFSIIMNDYTRAKSLFQESEVGLFKEVMIVLDQKIGLLKETIRKKLMDIPTSFEMQSKLIKYLKILDPDSDPGWDCINAYHLWLEGILWKIQNKYYKLVIEEKQNDDGKKYANNADVDSFIFSSINNELATGSYRQTFVTELLFVLTEKLDSFWKLSQSYTNENEETLQEKLKDFDQMLKNTVNVASWLLLNILVPTSLPESVAQQYVDQFVNWPKITTLSAQLDYLFFSLRLLRSTIKRLLNSQFTISHVQPLIELCMTIRLKCLGLNIENAIEAISNLSSCENWILDNNSKTSLPDLYVTEINEILPSVKEILSTNSFTGEVDLFSRERIHRMIIDLFLMLILHYKDCTDDLLQIKNFELNRITKNADVSSISNFSNNDDGKMKHDITGRKLLIALCNVEYVMTNCLPQICSRLAENGAKFCDYILEKSNQKFLHYRNFLLKHYITTKISTIIYLLNTAEYNQLPDEEDVSDFIKEIIMFVVFVQAELYLIFPQLKRQVLTIVIDKVLENTLKLIKKINLFETETVTQIVIDLSALEKAFQFYLKPQKKTLLNSTRLRFISNINKESFQESIQNFYKNFAMAIESLQENDSENLKSINENKQSFDLEVTNI